MATKITLVDNTIITADDNFTQVDDTYEFTCYCANYTELADIASKLTDDNMKKVVMVDINNNESDYSNMTCSVPKINIMSDQSNIKYVIRIKKKTDQDKAIEAMETAIQQFSDDDAKSMKVLYPEFDTLVGKTVDKDFKFVYYNILYKTAQSTTFSYTYIPGSTGTESLFTRLDETHLGTGEDPIPYYGNQILEKGKIYSDDEGTLWICTNGSGIAVFDRLINLSAFVGQWSDAEGTPSDPIIYAGGIALEKGKYYTQNYVIYECIRNSDIPIYSDLSGLIGNYVNIYNPYSTPPVEPTDPDTQEPDPDTQEPDPDTQEPGSEEYEKGTFENPIEYNNSMKLEKDKYYTQDGVVYKCTRDTIIPVYNLLKDLVNIYVQVASN